MKHWMGWISVLGFGLLASMGSPTADAGTGDVKSGLRSKVGSVFSVPVEYQGRYYFVSTAGVLFESSPDFKKAERLFEGKRQTLGALAVHDDHLYWGDGLHSDSLSTLHVFDLKTRKILKNVDIEGHIERPIEFSGDSILVPAGMGGVYRLDAISFKEIWRTRTHAGKPIHVDSNLVVINGSVCGASVYGVKGILCLDLKTGKETAFTALRKNPKSEIVESNGNLIGFSTEADLVASKFDIPSDLYVFEVKKNKLRFEKELRGFNFFSPFIKNGEAFVTLSTGDWILVNLETQKITFLGEFSEPFINNSFMIGDDYCAIGILGKFQCYSKTGSGAAALSKDRRILETVIGKILVKGKEVVIPTRWGYRVE
jgi:outer membrane protein assembly factor BamB